MGDRLAPHQPRVIDVPRHPRSVAFSADGAEVAFVTERGSYVANVATRAVRVLRKKAALSFAWPEAARGDVRAVTADGGFAIVDATTGDRRALHAVGSVYRFALSPDGRRVVASGWEGSWEGPCEGPLAWLPEEGPVAHGGGAFAIGDALFRPDREASNGPLAWLPLAVEAAAFAPSGDRVCIVGRGEVRLVDLADLPEAAPIGPTADVLHLAHDPREGRLAAIDHEGVVCVWRVASGELLSAFRVASNEKPIAWARDGHLLVGGRGLAVWDAEAGQRRAVHRIAGIPEVEEIHVRDASVVVRSREAVAVLDASWAVRAQAGPWEEIRIEQIDVSPDGSLVYVARGHEHATLAIATSDGRVVRELPEATAVAAAETFLALDTRPGSMLARDGSILVAPDGTAPEPMEKFSRAVALGDAMLCVNGATASVRARGEPRWRVQYGNDLRAVAVAPDAFFTGGSAAWVAKRSLEDGRLLRIFGAQRGGKVTALAFDPAGERLAVGEMEGRLHVWSLGAQPARVGLLDGTIVQPEGTIRAPGRVGSVSALAFAGPLVACANEVMVWSGDLDRIGQTEPRISAASANLVSRDGRRFLAGDSWGQENALFDDAGNELARWPGVEARDRFFDIADDGSLVLTASHNGDASELSVIADDGARVGTLRIEGTVGAVAFDRRGRVVGCLAERPTFFRWDPRGGGVERWCAAPAVELFGLDHFTRGGGVMVLWGGGTSYVLDEESGALLATLPRASRQTSVTAVAVSSDGRQVAIGDWSGMVRVFAIDGGAARCVAVLACTMEGGWWSVGSEGFTHVPNVVERP